MSGEAAYAAPRCHLGESEHVFAEDENGKWHVRTDVFWDANINHPIRCHTVCGGVYSCHVSSFPPVLVDRGAPHCRVCFPIGRRRSTAQRQSALKGARPEGTYPDKDRKHIRHG